MTFVRRVNAAMSDGRMLPLPLGVMPTLVSCFLLLEGESAGNIFSCKCQLSEDLSVRFLGQRAYFCLDSELLSGVLKVSGQKAWAYVSSSSCEGAKCLCRWQW